MQSIRKRDLLLLAVLLAIGLGMLLFFVCFGKKGSQVRVVVDGRTVGVWRLDENQTVSIPLSEGNINVFEIRDGKAFMTEANCPDGLCIKMGRISKSGESIICLPHKASVEIVDSENEVDGVVR